MSCTLCKLYLLDQHCQEAMFNFDFGCLFLLGGRVLLEQGGAPLEKGENNVVLSLKVVKFAKII